MQRQLYIDEAHTALDIFHFAVFFWSSSPIHIVQLQAEPLVGPIIGVRLRYRSKWEICSDLAPICSVLVKHKGYYLWKKSEPMILRYLSANI